MTPILKSKNAGEVRYNTAHRRTRCIFERCFGLLKRRFPCLHLGLRTALANTLVIIVATAVCIISPLYIEGKTLMKTLKMKMSHLTLLLQHTQVAMPNASSLFHDTLLNKINDLIKLHVRFIDNKIRKRKKTLTPINLINPLILLF